MPFVEWTDHGDRGFARVEIVCPVCDEPYVCYADDDTGCPQGCEPDDDQESNDD